MREKHTLSTSQGTRRNDLGKVYLCDVTKTDLAYSAVLILAVLKIIIAKTFVGGSENMLC